MDREKLTLLAKEEFKKLHERLKNRDDIIFEDGTFKLAGDFYKLQKRIALKNYDIIDPANIGEYIACGGYASLEKAIFDMSGEDIINTIKASLLRGRGGAGFPTGKKWEGAYRALNEQKYVICNADEGDPGAFMDRSILEGDPHSVLEGMAICGRAVGADKGFIYVRAEYPKAVSSLKLAIKQAEDMNLLGKNIMGSNFSFEIELRLGAGAFVCGESTALMESIEGHRGMPRNKEFRTTERGLWEKPTVINNVETFANVPQIIEKGAESFRSIGTEKSPGTKVFALVGKVKNAGLVEVPMGVPISTIVYDIGGGSPSEHEIKAVQTGGPSGGCIPKSLFNTGVDFESLEAIGSIMGSGGMVVMDEGDCMVDIAKFFLQFTVDESCGKCTPCRIGNKRLHEMLCNFTDGKAELSDIDKLLELSYIISETSLCGLGQTSANPVISTIRYFKEEYEEHARDKKCRAHVCKNLLSYFITEKCIGCTKCKRVCPHDAIEGEVKKMHRIIDEKCIKCGQCFEACPVKAIIKR